MVFRSTWAAILLVALSACNPIANIDGAENKIKEFQKVYNDGKPDALYRMTGDQFKKISSREEFQTIYDVIDARLGQVATSERINFNLNSNNGVTTTVIVMETSFEQGEGTETYTFHGHREDMQLVGWQVNSPRLMFTAEDLAKLNENESEQPEKVESE